jgi:HEAT repeat protein
MGAKAEPALPALRKALGDEDVEVSIAVVQAFVFIGSRSTPVLISALGDGNGRVRGWAARALGHLEAKTATADLLKLLMDSDAHVRTEAVDALESIHDKSTVSALVELLRTDKDREVRIAAASALGHYGRDANSAIPLLIEVMKAAALDEERLSAALGGSVWPSRAGLGEIASGALAGIGQDALPVVIKVLGDSKNPSKMRSAAMFSLRYMVWDHVRNVTSAVPTLLEVMNGADQELRPEALWLLRQIGPPAASALPALRAFLKVASVQDRVEAARALVSIDPANPLSVPVFYEGLEDKDSRVRSSAREALQSSDLVPALIATLENKNAKIREMAATDLGHKRVYAEPAIPALRQALKDPAKDVRMAAQQALQRIEEAIKEAEPPPPQEGAEKETFGRRNGGVEDPRQARVGSSDFAAVQAGSFWLSW